MRSQLPRWIGALVLVTTASLFAACCSIGAGDNAKMTADLQTVHEAVQFAIDEAQRTGIWDKTSKEQDHWQAACKTLKASAADSCAISSASAEDMCADSCRNGSCSPFMHKVCESALDGKASEPLCSVSGITGKRLNWCNAALSCKSSQERADKACSALKTVMLPRPKSATLTLSVEEARGANGSITLIVVSFGGGKSTTTAHTVTSVLAPRPRDKDYGIDKLPPLPEATPVSAQAKEMAADLASLIASAATAANSSYAPPDLSASAAAIGARPPLALKEFKVEFGLTIDQNGKLGLKKEWPSGPFGISAEASNEFKRTNKLEIVYSKSDD
jgi:hypothetical protein